MGILSASLVSMGRSQPVALARDAAANGFLALPGRYSVRRVRKSQKKEGDGAVLAERLTLN